MNIIITARHCEIPDDLRVRASELLTRVSKMVRRPQRAEITFDIDHQSKRVELILNLPRNQVRVAKAEADDFQTALDSALDKLKHQLDKDDPGKAHLRRRGAGEEPETA
jgi:ribosomal subunit interface protein